METLGSVAALAFILLLVFSPILAVLLRMRRVRGNVIVISKRRLLVVVSVTAPIAGLFSLVPFLSLIVITTCIWLIVRSPELKAADVSTSSTTVLETLERIQQDLAAADIHLRSLSSTIEVSQQELTEKEQRKRALQDDIEKHLHEVEAWQELSTEHKDLFVQAAREAMRQRSLFEATAVVAGGIVINLIACIIWVLIGSPGRNEIIEFLHRLF